MTAILSGHTRDVFALEPGGWLTVRRAMPELNDVSGLGLVARTQAELGRHLRYTRVPTGVVLLGEDRLGDDEQGLGRARNRLLVWLSGPPGDAGDLPTEQVIETALVDLAAGMTDLLWSQRERRIVVPAGIFSPVELEIRGVPGGVKVEGRLTMFDHAEDTVRAALGEYLARAQVTLRFARVELDPTSARVVAQATEGSLDMELPLALRGVAAGCHRLAREVAALTQSTLAEIYLRSIARDVLCAAESLCL